MECDDKTSHQPITKNATDLVCEISHAIKYEGATCLEDIVCRRLHLGHGHNYDKAALELICAVMKRQLPIEASELDRQQQALLDEKERFLHLIGNLKLG
jgi:glycerol-3-phosphate dehydrogenase